MASLCGALTWPKVRRVVILPGNGCGNKVRDANWYGWLESQLQGSFDDVVLRDMPDPDGAREAVWVPFINKELVCDKGAETVVVGHSSGAEAAMRYCETHRVGGLVLVSACHTDLGDESERLAGYYSRPWDWAAIRGNCGFIAQFHGDDDPFIPVAEARHVAENLKSEFHLLSGKSHFFTAPVTEIADVLERRCAAPPPSHGGAKKSILGFGSLLSEASARTTFPDLTDFRLVRVKGWRRVFAHVGGVFFERGIATSVRCASLSAEHDPEGGFIAACFQVELTEEAFQRFEDREEEFDLVEVPFHSLDDEKLGTGLLCARSSDERFLARWGGEVYEERYLAYGVPRIWGWARDSELEPCHVYLRHCVLAVTKAGPLALASFLDETTLIDRKTTVRAYLAEHPEVMDTRPPESLRLRYSG